MHTSDPLITKPSVLRAVNAAVADPYAEAFRSQLPLLSAVKQEDLRPMNLNPEATRVVVMRALPAIRAMRPQMVRVLTARELSLVDAIEVRGFAFAEAHARFERAVAPLAVSPPVDEANELLDKMGGELRSLAEFDVVDPQALTGLRADRAHTTLVYDLIGCVRLLEAAEQKDSTLRLKSNAALRARAIEVAREIETYLAERDARPRRIAEASLVRHQAFSFLAEAYGEARRAAEFIRYYEGDAEELVPTLYSGRKSRASKAGDDVLAAAGVAAPAVASSEPRAMVSSLLGAPAKAIGEGDMPPFQR